MEETLAVGGKKMKKILLAIVAVLIAIQAIRPAKNNPPVDPKAALDIPQNVAPILERSCFDCHSNQTRWPWYSQIAPISWGVIGHVRDGRKAMNFSEWAKIPKKTRIKRLKRAIQTVRNGMMPLPSYLWIHTDAKLNARQKEVLTGYFQKLLERLQKD